MIYIKKIINQDLDRTPTFNIESIRDFFKINLGNGEYLLKKIILIPSNKDFDVKFKKRETRDEYRVFLNDLFEEIKPTEGDILILRKRNQDVFLCEHITKTNKNYDYLNHLFEEKNNHQLIISDSENNEHDDDNVNQPINLLDKFIEWFIKLDGRRHNYYSDFFSKKKEKLKSELINYEEVYENEFKTKVFTTFKKDLNKQIETIKNNLEKKEGDFFEYSAKKSNHMPSEILGKNNYLLFLKELLNKEKTSSANSPKVNPINKIYFGAPGTGKSFRITEDLKEVDTIFQKRVAFHPEYDNASFVGGYKPITNSDGEINYEFVPQIFTNIYVEACNDPEHQYYLIIEEINRGNCAEIFGELFQLLDRDKKYKVTPSNELINYLNNNIQDSIFYVNGKMLLPDNLSILATMNTSDQSLFPMDSAFKRRWDWEYIPICYLVKDYFGKNNDSFDFEIDIEDGKKYSWIKFIEKINLNHIKVNPSLGMDKCIGNYFIKPDNGNVISLKPFINKVIFYLWNDVFKDEDNKVFEENTSYEDFFPIETNGKKKIKELFDRIGLEEKKSLSIVEDENSLGQVAESPKEKES